MFTTCVPQIAITAFKKLAEERISESFYLAGGTALALQMGHRLSVDLDFFVQKKFAVKKLLRNLSRIGRVDVMLEDHDSLCVEFAGAKLSFLYYPYQLLFPLVMWRGYGELADVRDVACMKIDAIASRGTKRDFVDLYYLLKQYSLPEILELFEKKYDGIHYNTPHIMKSIVYFADAEEDAIPRQTKPVSWGVIKKCIVTEVRRIQKQ